MSAAQLLEEVKKLSPPERELFVEAVLELPPAKSGEQNGAEPIVWPDIEARAKVIFGEKVFPNAVLEERESSDF